MVWGCICCDNKTYLVTLKGKIDSKSCQTCLNHHLKPKMEPGEYLVQDNAPVHVSASTRDWLKNEHMKFIEWPLHSPDLNPIENVWAMLTKIFYAADGKQYKSISELKEGLMLAWQSIKSQVINPYIDSMSDRILIVFVTKVPILNINIALCLYLLS